MSSFQKHNYTRLLRYSLLMTVRRLALTSLLLVAAACSSPEAAITTAATPPAAQSTPADRKYLLERVDDAAVVQLYADGFEKLPLKQKTLIWHLYQAAIAGRDIFIDQKHRDALAMRDILDPIMAYPQNVEPAVRAEIERYTKLFWLNNGPYNNLTARKFVLKLTPDQLWSAVQAAGKSGARFNTGNEGIEAKLKRLQPMFFDPTVDPIVTNKTPGAGRDILEASANNLYLNVSMADLKGFTE
jgi:dipeptidyl-peptidase-3